MAIKLLTDAFGFAAQTIVRDLSYDIEARLVALSIATYNTAGGVEQPHSLLPPSISYEESSLVFSQIATAFADGKAILLNAPTIAYSQVAFNNATSINVPTVPTEAAFSGQIATDLAFNLSTGVITFSEDSVFSSVVSVMATCSSGTPTYFTDAEFSTDGGTTWARGVNSCRAEELQANRLRTREFGFSGKFVKGTKLRFVEWASTAGVVLETSTQGGSVIPARRLTYSRIPCRS